jgi:hypothetical protein
MSSANEAVRQAAIQEGLDRELSKLAAASSSVERAFPLAALVVLANQLEPPVPPALRELAPQLYERDIQPTADPNAQVLSCRDAGCKHLMSSTAHAHAAAPSSSTMQKNALALLTSLISVDTDFWKQQMEQNVLVGQHALVVHPAA